MVQTQKKDSIVITRHDHKLSAAEVAAAVEQMQALKQHPREDANNRFLLKRAERVYQELPLLERHILSEMLDAFEAALESQESELIALHRAPLGDYLERGGKVWWGGGEFGCWGGEGWRPENARLDTVAKTAMIVNLVNADNLPSYNRENATAFGRDGAWGSWVGRWTAEEGRHGIAMRDYLVVTRGSDPVKLEELRMTHMAAGYDSGEKTMLEALAYVSFQELATRVSHRNTGKATGCPIAEKLLQRIALDENLHMVFYRNMIAAAFDLAPDAAMEAVRNEVVGFHMPGSTMPDFQRHSLTIAKAGIYDLRLHYEEVVMPVLRFWKVFERNDLGPAGESAREELANFVAGLDTASAAFVAKREEAAARKAARQAAR